MMQNPNIPSPTGNLLPNPNVRKLPRAEFNYRLSRMVLAHAGLEPPHEEGEPKAFGLRQKIAKKRAVKLGRALATAKSGFDVDAGIRQRIDDGIHSGSVRWKPVTKQDTKLNKLAIKSRHKTGEISDFHLPHELGHASHFQSEHHMIMRRLTDEEKSKPVPLNAREQKRKDDLDRLVGKAVRLGEKGTPKTHRRDKELEYSYRRWLTEGPRDRGTRPPEQAINWDKKLDIDSLLHLRDQIEQTATTMVDVKEEAAAARGEPTFHSKKEFDIERQVAFDTMVPEYLGIMREDFEDFIPLWRKAFLRKVLLELEDDPDPEKSELRKFVEQRDTIQDSKDAAARNAEIRRGHIEGSGVPY